MYSYDENSTMKDLNSNDHDRKISPKKKKRKYNIDSVATNINVQQHNLNNQRSNNNLSINIIDRVLDLSKYDKNTGLYTLSRNWINATTSINDSKNNDHLINKNFTSSTRLSNEDNNDLDSFYITSLPEPSVKDLNQIESINKINEDIEIDIRSSEKSDIDIINSLNLTSDDYLIQTHALLKLHVNRWKSARKEWLNYYKKTNEPFKSSYDILKSIYEDV